MNIIYFDRSYYILRVGCELLEKVLIRVGWVKVLPNGISDWNEVVVGVVYLGVLITEFEDYFGLSIIEIVVWFHKVVVYCRSVDSCFCDLFEFCS